ncbi:MAG: CotH kinase family protein [Flavobacteriales bacterium]
MAYPQDEVATVKILIHPDSLSWILAEPNLYSNHEFPATFIYQSSSINDTVLNIGFRLRGNTSREAEKKSFKVSFNTFENRKWNGLEKMNLNGQHNDVSLLRTKLCWDMMRESGLPGCRTSFVALYINDEYRGLYLNTEHIDENFAAKYFDQQGDGALYKCLYPADLTYLGSNQQDYKLEVFGRRIYQLKTNTWADDYSTIRDFATLLNTDFNETNTCDIYSSFDVDRYIQYLALEVIQGHWDGYVYNTNNYYLYSNDQNGQMEWIPYDLDNTLGIDWFGINWTNRNIYNWKPSGQARPLYSFIMNNQILRDKFSFYVQKFLQSFYEGEWLDEKVNYYQELIGEFVASDPYYPLDYGFTMEDFENAATSAWGGHIAYGLNSYFFNRRISALSTLEQYNENIMFSNIIDETPFSAVLEFQGLVENAEHVFLQYSINDQLTELELFDDGNYPDNFSSDSFYHAHIEINEEDEVYYRLKGITSNGDEYFYPCNDEWMIKWSTIPSQRLEINEVMAENFDTYPDESGNFSDWIEIYNGSGSNVNLQNFYLSDDIQNWNKWKLPNQIQLENSFRTYWADNQPELGISHCNFAISNGNENIYLFQILQGFPRLVDFAVLPNIPTNQSYGRVTELSDMWMMFENTTPNAPNAVLSVIEYDENIMAYPNPTTSLLNLNRYFKEVNLFTSQGTCIQKQYNVNQMDLGHLPNGVYLLIADQNRIKVVVAH